MKTICLCMIVKNEEKVLRRCLSSVIPYIDHWVICNTGSNDKTAWIIDQQLSDIPGTLLDHEWVDFGHNRTLAIQAAKGKADYILLLDADMELIVDDSFDKENLDATSYLIRYTGDLNYAQKLLVSGDLNWNYVGVTHEYINSLEDNSNQEIKTLSITHHCDSVNRDQKFQRDIELLSEGLKKDPDNSRYVFYLAQSYRDIQNYTKALEYYNLRVEMGGWTQEVWYAKYQIGRCLQLNNAPWSEVLNAHMEAYEFRPTRSEPLYEIGKYYRQHKKYSAGYLFLESAHDIPYPHDDVLFIHTDTYEWSLKDEYALCAFYCNRQSRARELWSEILPSVPDHEKKRIQDNIEWTHKKNGETK